MQWRMGRPHRGGVALTVVPTRRAIAEALALKKKSEGRSKPLHKGPSMPARPYKKWPDEKLDAFVADMKTKISMMDDKLQMYNIRLRAYSLEKTHRGLE